MKAEIYKVLEANIEADEHEYRNASKALAGVFSLELREFANALYSRIEHGDDEHRQWLRNEIDNFIKDRFIKL